MKWATECASARGGCSGLRRRSALQTIVHDGLQRSALVCKARACVGGEVTLRQEFHSLGPPNGLNGHTLHGTPARPYGTKTGSSLDKPSRTLVAGSGHPGGGTNMFRQEDGSHRYSTHHSVKWHASNRSLTHTKCTKRGPGPCTRWAMHARPSSLACSGRRCWTC
jgi:hypothetical protein